MQNRCWRAFQISIYLCWAFSILFNFYTESENEIALSLSLTKHSTFWFALKATNNGWENKCSWPGNLEDFLQTPVLSLVCMKDLNSSFVSCFLWTLPITLVSPHTLEIPVRKENRARKIDRKKHTKWIECNQFPRNWICEWITARGSSDVNISQISQPWPYLTISSSPFHTSGLQHVRRTTKRFCPRREFLRLGFLDDADFFRLFCSLNKNILLRPKKVVNPTLKPSKVYLLVGKELFKFSLAA